MLRYILGCVLLGLFATEYGESARILAIFPFPSKSHLISFTPLLEELAKRGHELTVISVFPRKTPLKNYKDITIDNYFSRVDMEPINMFEIHDQNVLLFNIIFRTVSVQFCEEFLKEPSIQNLIHGPDQQFDLIIYEPFYTECAYGLIHKFKAPFIQISPNTIAKWMGDGVGNPFFNSYIPDMMLGYSDHMSFWERIKNALFVTIVDLERNWITIPRMESVMRKYLDDPTIPSIHEIETNASFLLLNSHISLNYPRPLTPNTAEVGGMHLREPQKLPKDLKKLLDKATDGVIYFSFGSNIQSTEMPDEIRQHFLNSFSKLKQKVLWKWEDDELPGKPQNVHTSKWFPQSDILGHPNVRLFITHGGLMSTQEATYFGVPLIAIPFMADQKQNAKNAVARGYAITLNVNNITKKALDWALNEVLTDKRYRENALRLSGILKDQPQKPLDTAVFWTEYVIRHKGAPHMRSAALELNFFQYYLLDVIAVVTLAVFVLTVVLAIVVRKIFRRIFSKPNPAKSNTLHKKTN